MMGFGTRVEAEIRPSYEVPEVGRNGLGRFAHLDAGSTKYASRLCDLTSNAEAASAREPDPRASPVWFANFEGATTAEAFVAPGRFRSGLDACPANSATERSHTASAAGWRPVLWGHHHRQRTPAKTRLERTLLRPADPAMHGH